jgi:elongator complex protein 5
METVANIIIETLIIIDTLHPLASRHPTQLPLFLSSLLAPSVSVVAIYHTDIPLPHHDDYNSHPLTTLTYLATAILKVESLYAVIMRKRARDRSLQEPGWGLGEGREGVLVGLKGEENMEGVVLEMELRRKSGRGVRETFVLSPPSANVTSSKICLLDDHPLYAPPKISEGEQSGDGNGEVETTFNLGLTEKQRRDREGVVLPYFDAQEGGGEGGRILYEMEDIDDFDEEEDEI